MKNVVNVPKQLVLRKFDLKGSKFDREVLQKLNVDAAVLPNYSNFEEYYNLYEAKESEQCEMGKDSPQRLKTSKKDVETWI